MRTRQTQQLLRPPLSLCHCRRPTYLHLHRGFSRSNRPAPPPPPVPCPPCKPQIPPARPPSLPANFRPSPCTSSSREPWPAPARLSPTRTARRGHTHYCLSLLQISSLRSGGTHGTLSPSPSNLSGCKCPTYCTLHSCITKHD